MAYVQVLASVTQPEKRQRRALGERLFGGAAELRKLRWPAKHKLGPPNAPPPCPSSLSLSLCCSIVTNSFDFVFAFDLERDASTGAPRPPMLVLPSTEQQALEVARLFGPGAPKAHLRHPASLRPSEL